MFDDLEDVGEFLTHLRRHPRVQRRLRRREGASPPGSTWAGLRDLLAPIQWEWPGWLPRGFLTILDSLGGLRSQGSNAIPIANLLLALADLARIAGKPVLLTHHFRKRTSRHAGTRLNVDRLLGSSATAQSAHVIWALDTPDLAEPDHRRLSVIKNNLPLHPCTLQFLQKTAQAGPSLPLHFGPAPQEPTSTSEFDRAIDFLQELLADGPLSATQVKSEYEAAGFSRRTVRRAKKRLGVNSFRPQGKQGRHEWHWELPAEK